MVKLGPGDDYDAPSWKHEARDRARGLSKTSGFDKGSTQWKGPFVFCGLTPGTTAQGFDRLLCAEPE